MRLDRRPVSKLLAFKPAPELSSSQSEAAVAIVGGGPVGLALALELARFGVRSAVIEARDRIDPGSRAICISRRSMDILDGIEVGDAFRAKGLGWVRGRSFYRSRVVFELEMPFPPLEKHFPMTNLQQSSMEELLVDRAERQPEIDLRWQSQVTDVNPGTDIVRCSVETPAGDYQLCTPYLVACDGVFVRGLLDAAAGSVYLRRGCEQRRQYRLQRRLRDHVVQTRRLLRLPLQLRRQLRRCGGRG